MSRRTELADAAITTLACEGMRGLTHRNVDRTAGLPQGSTSYYFPTRKALIEAVVERVTEVTVAVEPDLPTDLDELAVVIAGYVRELLTRGRDHQLACYELMLEATRRPELRELLTPASATIREMAADRLEAAGVTGSADRARDFVAFLDGLLLEQITGSGGRELDDAALRVTVRRMLTAVMS
ncbi:TetR family transcriptional regulator [Saccharopolyspora erythraea]|uniref:TetR/AcrR family transcriptional regulator n=1 Tax=Saccharopolyspora erythraea TaxID=1836 RepID=UPI001BADF78F|nr:TetR family transcriptional regulator [Saccharopolyspora erythraea]QUH01397.1 TetR family transcriptional regulator [Saccharopolyspora erythraea]